MNKAELKAKWSKYCDTDKLVDDMRKLLTKHGNSNTENGVCIVLDEYFTNKEPLIKLFASSNHYIGNMRIVTKRDFERGVSVNEVSNFIDHNLDVLGEEKLYQFVDENNKTMFDYMKTGKMAVRISELPKKKSKELEKFSGDYKGATVASVRKAYEYRRYIGHFRSTNNTSLPRDYCYENGPKLKAGTKTSRAFNQVCTHYGIDKMNPQTVTVMEHGKTVTKTRYPYNKVLAAYSDLVSDLVRQMYFVISLNPLDYLTMSVGVSWHSCHHLADGGWRGGCLSYMMDSTSIITYVINNMDEALHDIPKFYRQMFHYDKGMFVQSRLYPQGNDGSTNLYEKFKGYVQEEFCEMLQLNDVWDTEAGYKACSGHINSEGMHYKDYNSRNDCNVFYPHSKANEVHNHVMTVGHEGLCVKCGKPLYYSNEIAHDNCDNPKGRWY